MEIPRAQFVDLAHTLWLEHGRMMDVGGTERVMGKLASAIAKGHAKVQGTSGYSVFPPRGIIW